MVGVVHQVRVVMDSSWVIRDLRWLVGTRTSPAARTAFQEVLDSQTVIAYAPKVLRHEVEKHIPQLAWDLRVDEEQVREHRQKYQASIHFLNTPSSPRPEFLRDPTDEPFIYVYATVGAEAILSSDKDLQDSTARVVNLDVVLSLRDYARAAAPEMTVKLGGTVVLVAGIHAIRLAVDGLRGMYRGFVSLPLEIRAILLVLAVLAATHSKTRTTIVDGLRSMSARAIEAATLLAPFLARLASDLALQQEEAQGNWEATGFPGSRRYSARLVAYAVCLAASEPLWVGKIEQRMRAAGYRPAARRFRPYLLRVLRGDPRFTEVRPGLWTLSPPDRPSVPTGRSRSS
ncbi:MAG: hypothetical protein M1389_12915 [Chloroflexi bacterium]|nr:hypothetical protein [Chloroflexota bacterium]